MTAGNGIEERIAALRHSYAQELPQKVAAVQGLWSQVRSDTVSAEVSRELLRLSHSLVGSGATFGFQAVSDAARGLEALVGRLVNGAPCTAETSAEGDCLLAALFAASQQPPQGSMGMGILPAQPASQPAPPQNNHLVFVVDDDASFSGSLMLQIEHFGYRVRHFADPAAMRLALSMERPAAIIMDVMFPDGRLGGIEAVARLRSEIEDMPPVMFLSSREDITARLEAVRAGGSAYLIKPVDILNMVNRLDRLTSSHTPEPYRVLVVEDSHSLAEYYAWVLRQVGMTVEVVTDPLTSLGPLESFSPDLVLLDMNMPHCSGAELAAVIRQHDAHIGLPIVFLSAETNIDKQFAAMHVGADDFLTKPIQANHLISAVETRAGRYRRLKSMMFRDSLTGLLNHTAIKDQLETEVARQEREGGSCVFAMIDIDHFKAVNDTHGHAAGDRVIKALGRLLSQRLRHSDAVGRYGGEEFAAVLPRVDEAGACKLLDVLREDFARLRHIGSQGEFSVTFSCGLAAYPRHGECVGLMEAADQALYRAKRAGRNRVEMAG